MGCLFLSSLPCFFSFVSSLMMLKEFITKSKKKTNHQPTQGQNWSVETTCYTAHKPQQGLLALFLWHLWRLSLLLAAPPHSGRQRTQQLPVRCGVLEQTEADGLAGACLSWPCSCTAADQPLRVRGTHGGVPMRGCSRVGKKDCFSS